MSHISRELGSKATAATRDYIVGTNYGNADTYITNASGFDNFITQITLVNTDSSAIIVTILRVPPTSGGGADTADINDVWHTVSVPGAAGVNYGIRIIDVPFTLHETNETLQLYAGTTDKVNCFIDGVIRTRLT